MVKKRKRDKVLLMRNVNLVLFALMILIYGFTLNLFNPAEGIQRSPIHPELIVGFVAIFFIFFIAWIITLKGFFMS